MATAKIETTVGVIEIELLDDAAPKTVENFVTLAKKGFYDGVIFHRVVPGFVIQGGDPDGTGMGGPGYDMGGPSMGGGPSGGEMMGEIQPKARKMAAAKKQDEDDDNWGNVDALLE